MRARLWQVISTGFIFLLFFETIATLSQSPAIRPPSYLAPLALSAIDDIAVFSDELGTNSDIYRGQAVRAAAFGTSFTMGIETPSKSNWSRALQAARPSIHIQNFSMVGGWDSFLANIEKAKSTGITYDYIFVSLTLVKGNRSTTPNPEHKIFLHSDRFQVSTGFPHSLHLLYQVFGHPQETNASLSKLFRALNKLSPVAAANAQVRSVFDPKNTVTMEHMKTISACYERALVRSQCRERFEMELSATGRSQKDIYYDTYLACQTEVDRTCGAPVRLDFVPHFEINQVASYREQIKILLDLVRPLGKRTVLVSQAIFSHSDSPNLYKMLAKNNSASLGFALDRRQAVAMSTHASWQRSLIRNNEIRDAARALRAEDDSFDFLDLAESVDGKSDAESLFYDFAHLTPKGHKFYSEFLIEQLGL